MQTCGRKLCSTVLTVRAGAWCLLPLLCVSARAGSQPPTEVPAEERRLSAEDFREGLKKRGLTELLELHLREFPPANVASMLLIQRELKLAEAIDPTLTRAERRAALKEANELLETLIGQAADDPRLMEWQLDLARSRLYDEGEPYFTSILYRGRQRRGSPAAPTHYPKRGRAPR